MSLNESYSDLSKTHTPELSNVPPVSPDIAQSIDPKLLQLRETLVGILAVEGEQHAYQQRVGRVYIFRGHLQLPPETAYATLVERFKPLGYTPMLQREHDEEVVLAVEGDVPYRRINTRWWLHAALLLITIITTTVMGAALTGMPTNAIIQALQTWDTSVLWPVVRDGLPFSLTLLGILGVHEMGHYVAARLHKVKVTLPFFIPVPVPYTLGTLGAVIFIKSPLINRRALFDVGIAGPLAGLIVAIPLYVIGLNAQQTVGFPTAWIQMGYSRVSNPPLLQGLAALANGDIANLDRYVLYGHPMALAAWFGVLLTGLNLLPIGQFDGGHVVYALFGRRAWPIAMATFSLLVLGGVMAWTAWLIWAFMGLLTGLRHPPPHDDLTPLGIRRTVLGVITIVLFFLILVPVPFYSGF